MKPIRLPDSQRSLPNLNIQNSKGLLQWLSSVDHKQIGIMYLLFSALFLSIGGIAALLFRIQLAIPNNTFIGPEMFNQLFTMHGTTMVFFVLTPAILGFSVYFIPLMIGANEMAFPRLNAFSLWIALFGALLLYFSFFNGGAPDGGWFNYAPLNEKQYNYTNGIDYYCIGLLLGGIGTTSTAINLIVTILKCRMKNMDMRDLPIFAWMVLINSFLILAAFPAINAAICMLLLDRQLHAHFFNAITGGSPLLWQHLFWLFGHPEVYILILPSFGILSEVFQVFSRKPIFGYKLLVGSGIVIALLAFGVWMHHMFTTGLGIVINGFFSASSLLIGVATGIKIFSWIATMWGGSIRFTTSMLFACAFLIEFTIGGLSGISFAIVPLDWQLTDTYYVVAHIHYVFIGGSLFGLLSGLFYWFPKMSGRRIKERSSKLFFWLFVIGFNMTFLVQHALGVMGMSRRVYTYPDIPGFESLNMISTIGGGIMGFSVLYLFYLLLNSKRKGDISSADPWDAYTLEWMTSSPPTVKNFDTLPPIHSERPFRDWKIRLQNIEKNK